MDPWQPPVQPPAPGSPPGRDGVALPFACGFLLFWFGGLASCTTLGAQALRIGYPFVIVIGIGLQVFALVRLLRRDEAGRSGCLIGIIILSLLASGGWAVFSCVFVYHDGGWH